MTPSTLVGRWGSECSVPVRLAPVMAHLGSYEEILAHVFHTSVRAPLRYLEDSLHTQNPHIRNHRNKGDQVEQGIERAEHQSTGPQH